MSNAVPGANARPVVGARPEQRWVKPSRSIMEFMKVLSIFWDRNTAVTYTNVNVINGPFGYELHGVDSKFGSLESTGMGEF